MSTAGTRRPRTPVVVVASLLLVVVVTVLTRDDVTYPGALDPRNPGPVGAQALARVLDDQGVQVRVVRGQQALLDLSVDARTSVVVTNPQELGASTWSSLRRHASGGGGLMLVGAAPVLVRLLDLAADGTGSPTSGSHRADCDLSLARDLVVRTRKSSTLPIPGCFAADGEAVLARAPGSSRSLLLSSPEVLSNERILDADNAALGLRLLGQQQRLVWYVADTADTAATDGVSFSLFLPAWALPALWLVALSLLALVLLKGRRLGPLVREPLPVVVRATESTLSRGRMYRRSGDRTHAAQVLSAATGRRLAAALRLPRDVGPPELVAALAARTGRDSGALHNLLTAPAVGSDAELVDHGRHLLDLENEVRSP